MPASAKIARLLLSEMGNDEGCLVDIHFPRAAPWLRGDFTASARGRANPAFVAHYMTPFRKVFV